MRQLILASGSQRRKDILEFLGVPFRIVHSDFPEEDVFWEEFDDPHDFVRTIALGKALTVAPSFDDAIIIAADTSVFLREKNFGKPQNLDDARRILTELSGNTHKVVTGIVMLDTLTQQKEIISVETAVEFLPLSSDQIESYISTSESMGKAGAYAIQLGARPFVKKIDGSLSNVVGLPIEETVGLLETFDIPIDIDVDALVREQFTFQHS